MLNQKEKMIAVALMQTGMHPTRAATLIKGDNLRTVALIVPVLKELKKTHKAVDGSMIEKTEHSFILHSLDRSTPITEEFLAYCAPEWAAQIRSTIESFDEES